MEPQINYSGMPSQQVYGKKKSGCGKFAIIGTLILLAVITGTAYFIYTAVTKIKNTVDIPNLNFGPPKENPENIDKRFTGSFMDAVILTGSDGSQKLWILSDASVKYMLKQKSTGRFSMGLACNDCKTISYLFDPASGKVERQTVNTFSDIIRQSHIVQAGGKIIQFTNPTEKDGARINIYEPSTGEIISDTKSFIEKHAELSSGIIDLTFHDDNQTVTFSTKDGQKWLVYNPYTDKIYEDEIKMRKELRDAASDEPGNLFVLRQEKSDQRMSFYKITAPKKDIIDRASTLVSYVENTSFLKSLIPAAIVEKVNDKKYLSGKVYSQDDNFVVIVYLDQAGKVANRIVSCFDAKTGNELWTLGQDQLFPEMKIDEGSGASLSFTEGRTKIKRYDNIFLLSYEGTGIMGIETKTGKKLWEVEIHAK